LVVGTAKPLQDCASRAIRETEVMDHRIGWLCPKEVQGFLARRRLTDLQTRLVKASAEHLRDAVVVFDHKHPWRHPSSLPPH
jgi:hypothetical protein